MASSTDPIAPSVARQLGGGVQTAPLVSHGLLVAHRRAREAAHARGDDRPLVLVVPGRGPLDTLYVVQSGRLADLIAAGTCEGAQVVRLTRELVRKTLDDFPGGVLPGAAIPAPTHPETTDADDARGDDWPF